MTGTIIFRFVIGLCGVALGILVLIKVFRKHKKIDTESIAVVNSVQDLGRLEGSKVYAVRYNIQSSDPFELLETPCKKAPKSGAERVIYYEKENPSANYYFKSIGTFDKRLIPPSLLLFAGVVVLASAIAALL